MTTNFDTPIQLRKTHSAKYDMMGRYSGVDAADGLPMWVADMDFQAAPAVQNALQAEIDRGTYGYFGDDSTTRAAICGWMAEQHGWRFDPDALIFTRGVVSGLGITLDAFTQPGDSVILFTPVYHAFARKIASMERNVHESLLVLKDGAYHMDLDELQDSLTPDDKMVVFCSPHNPGGRLWSEQEIQDLAAFCAKNDLILVSDEIHMDLAFPGKKHLPTATAAPTIAPKLVTLSAASKGFNLAGGETGFIIAEDPEIMKKLTVINGRYGGSCNRFGMIMTEAAFTQSTEWSQDVRAYLADNFKVFRDGVNAVPGLNVMEMGSTYLAWVDFSGTGMEQAEINDRIAKTARIATNPGTMFGSGGELCHRFNLAMPRATIEEAVARIQNAFSDLQ